MYLDVLSLAKCRLLIVGNIPTPIYLTLGSKSGRLK